MNPKTWIVLGACLGALAVALGAFGAHGLPRYYQLVDLAATDSLHGKGPANWEIAARYHMYHALAMLGVGILADRKRLLLLDAAGVLFFVGILVFSGCLYAWALTGTNFLVHAVPVGGVSYILGWAVLALAGTYFAADAKPRPTLAERLEAAKLEVEAASGEKSAATAADEAAGN